VGTYNQIQINTLFLLAFFFVVLIFKFIKEMKIDIRSFKRIVQEGGHHEKH